MASQIIRHAYRPVAAVTPSYLINEGWESGSEPSGWTHVGTGVNYNYTTTVLEGAKSLGILGTVDSAAQFTYAGQSAGVYHFFMFRFTALPSGTINGLGITDSGLNAIAYAGLNSSGTLTINLVGGGSTTTTGTMAANTLYYVKMKFIPGSPGIATIEFTTDGIFRGGANFASTSQNPDTTTPAGISLENYSSGNTWIFDHVRAFGQDLGDFSNWP